MIHLMAPRKDTIFAMNEEDSANRTTTLLMSPEGYVSAAIVLFLIGFFGFFLNIIVIFLLIKDKELRSPMNIVLFNLACSDFSVSVLGNPFTLISAVYRHWIFGRTMCVIYGFFMSLLGINSITTLTVLSFERYIMISLPFHRHRLTKRSAKLAVVFIWLYSFSLTGPPLFGWGDYISEAADISCSVNWEHKNLSTTTYILFLFALGLVIPLAVITYSYFNIIHTLRTSKLRTSWNARAESKVAIMVFLMVLAFLVAWMPYAVLALIIAFGDPASISPGVAIIPALVAKSSICYNPIIYAGLNTQFQSSWRKLMGLKGVGRTREGAELTTVTPTGRHQGMLSQKQMSEVITDNFAQWKVAVTSKHSNEPSEPVNSLMDKTEKDCDATSSYV